MKLAAIDIGSNAIRFQVTNVIRYKDQLSFKKLEYIRFPLRLGNDVFKYNEIRSDKADRFFRLMNAFKQLIDLYEVDDYYACATSAMRESENGRALVARVKQLLDLTIHIIDGNEEAKFINNIILKNLSNGNYLHIDVGGGSTELNVIQNKKTICSKSFKLGSVRTLEAKDSKNAITEMNQWIQDNTEPLQQGITAIGTGGNIQKLYELSERNGKTRAANYNDLVDTQTFLNGLSAEEKMNQLKLNSDRADVIVPASIIYLEAMKAAQAEEILVPDVGLKDGIMQMLYEKHLPDALLDFK
ncbi:Ppx/GppA phosphatase family protein [Roseivirga sp.]|uniref:Ppx/GppA phosphatase family protein n=1 Tax=Roseivirga sp. TaxID=1964215 RepID=UPI003B8E36B4